MAVPGSGACFLFSAEIAIYPGQVSWLRSGTFFHVPSPFLPRLQGRVDIGDSSSFTVAGPHRDCTGLPFSALAGTLGLKHLYHTTGFAAAECSNGPACERSGRVRSTSRKGSQACPKAATVSPMTRSGISKASLQERLAVPHRSPAENSKA